LKGDQKNQREQKEVRFSISFTSTTNESLPIWLASTSGRRTLHAYVFSREDLLALVVPAPTDFIASTKAENFS
jgi:hypothetical protein